MSRITKFAGIAVAIALFPLGAEAQQGATIRGVVRTADLEPLSAVAVQVVGTNLQAATNARGEFQLNNVPAGQQTITATHFRYVQGSETVTVTTGSSPTVNFSLEPSAVRLDEVVANPVTNLGESTRSRGTRNGMIRGEDIANAPVHTMAEALTGRVAGLTIQSTSGSTGVNQRIRIRGTGSISLGNEPLFFVDGIQYSTQTYTFYDLLGGPASSRLNDINPADVENIEVLRGPAATSIYGTAAANGVILITTKRGVSDETRISAYSEQGVIEEPNQWPANIFSYQLNRPGQPAFRSNGSVNVGSSATSDRMACYNMDAAAGLCRQDSTAVFNTLEDPRTTPFTDGFRRKFGANISGGTALTTYYVAGDWEEEQGVISYNTLEKAGVRANLDAHLTDEIDLQINTSYLGSKLMLNSNGNTQLSPVINGLVGRAFFNPDTTSGIYSQNYAFFTPRELESYQPIESIDRLMFGGRASYRPSNWLSFSVNSGLDFTNRFMELTVQPGQAIAVIAPSFYGDGSREIERTNQYLWTSNASAHAEYSVSPLLRASTTVGASFRRELYRTLFNAGAGLVEGTSDIGGTSGQFDLDEEFREVRTIGGFASQQFGYDERLFLTLGVRGDDDSTFGSEFGLIYYPNFNFSWVVDEESWFPQSPLLSSFRLRSGYGTSGLRPDFRDATTLFAASSVQVGGQDLPAVLLDVTGNPGLKPERISEYEVGFDAGFFDDRLSANLTYYNRKSEDALIAVPLEPSFGLTNQRLANIGSVRNKGFELGISALVLNDGPVQLQLGLATTTLDNEVLTLGGDDIQDVVLNNGLQRHRPGYPAGAYFQDRFVIDDDGDGLLKGSEVELDPDVIDGEEVPHFIGPILPTLTNALSGDLRLFDFITIGTLFEHRGGNYMHDLSTAFRCDFGQVLAARGCDATADPNASLESQAAYIAGTFLSSSAGYIHKADYVKWRELSVTISPPPSMRRTPWLRGATLTLAGRNLKTWTDYPGMDPEGVVNASGNFSQSEFNIQPPVRYWTARLNLNF